MITIKNKGITAVSVHPYHHLDVVNKVFSITKVVFENTIGWVLVAHWADGRAAVITYRQQEEYSRIAAEAYCKENNLNLIETWWDGNPSMNIGFMAELSGEKRDWYCQKLIQDHYLEILKRLVLDAESDGILLEINRDQQQLKEKHSVTFYVHKEYKELTENVSDPHVNYAIGVAAGTIMVSDYVTNDGKGTTEFNRSYVGHHTPGADWTELMKANMEQYNRNLARMDESANDSAVKVGVSIRPYNAIDELNKTVELQPEGVDKTTVGWVVLTHWSNGVLKVLARRESEAAATLVAEAYCKETSVPLLKPTWK